MWIRIIGFGTNWWSPRLPALNKPLCPQKGVVWFNSAGLMCGRRLRLYWAYPGHIRFNRNSGFHPEFPRRALGRIYQSEGPKLIEGRLHLLLSRATDLMAAPSRYLVTMTSGLHGLIAFTSRTWKSSSAQPISISLHAARYEAMLLLGPDDWVRTDAGFWTVSTDGLRLELSTVREEMLS